MGCLKFLCGAVLEEGFDLAFVDVLLFADFIGFFIEGEQGGKSIFRTGSGGLLLEVSDVVLRLDGGEAVRGDTFGVYDWCGVELIFGEVAMT